MIVHVVSISGGKDSTATGEIALERHGPDAVRLVAADTGNEAENWSEYLDYLRKRWNHPIDVVRADFTIDLERKRKFILEKWPEHGVALEVCQRAAELMKPTGNPFLDLCLWKGRFPSRKAQFCTQELKRYPLDEYVTRIITEEGHQIESWQGVRRDESLTRAHLKERELSPEGWWVNRPIVAWTSNQVIGFLVGRKIDPNPLYFEGFARVGCAPCINSSKTDLNLWHRRHPEMIDKIAEWERLVGLASKLGVSSFIPAVDGARGERQGKNIRAIVEWSKTSRGGRQLDMYRSGPINQCSSVYGLCE